MLIVKGLSDRYLQPDMHLIRVCTVNVIRVKTIALAIDSTTMVNR